MQDVAWKADGPRELRIDVNRVEVAGSPRIAMRHVLVGHNRECGHLRTGLGPKLRLGLRHQPALTMLVHVPFTTGAPSWLLDFDSHT